VCSLSLVSQRAYRNMVELAHVAAAPFLIMSAHDRLQPQGGRIAHDVRSTPFIGT
jgi:hypothetical protein